VKSKPSSIFWALFSLLLWLFMIHPILNPPWTEDADPVHDEKYFSFSPNRFSDHEFAENLTVVEFEEEYIKSSVFSWLFWSILTVLGTYSSWLIFRDAKYWPLLVLVVTGLSCIRVIPIAYQFIESAPTVSRYLSYVWSLFVRELTEGFKLTSFMYSVRVFVWPYLCSILFLYAGFKLMKSISKFTLPPNKRMQSDRQTATRFVDR